MAQQQTRRRLTLMGAVTIAVTAFGGLATPALAEPVLDDPSPMIAEVEGPNGVVTPELTDAEQQASGEGAESDSKIATVGDPTLVQREEPKVFAGHTTAIGATLELADGFVDSSNAEITFVAPKGLKFARSLVTAQFAQDAVSRRAAGVLSADGTTLVASVPGSWRGSVALSAAFTNEGPFTSTGLIGGGSVTVGSGIDLVTPGLTTELAYRVGETITAAVPEVIAAGATGAVAAHMEIPAGLVTEPGVSLRLTAPSGTTFEDTNFVVQPTAGANRSYVGRLNGDRKTLTVYMADTYSGEFTVYALVRSEADNVRVGVVADGSIEIIGGQEGLPTGARALLSYEAVVASVPDNDQLVVVDPAVGAVVSAGIVTFSGTAAANTEISLYSITSGSSLGVGTADADGKWSVTVNRPLAVGTYTIGVTDGLTDLRRAFSVRNAVPDSLTVTSPAQGATVAPGAVTFTGRANAGATINLVSAATGARLGTGTAQANGGFTVNVNKSLVSGRYAIRVVNGSASVLRSFIVGTHAASLEVLSPQENASVARGTVTFSGKANPGAAIELRSRATGLMLGGSTAAADGTWSADVDKRLGASTYVIRVVNGNLQIDRAFQAK